MGERRISRLFGGLGHGEPVPSYWEEIAKWTRAGVDGETIYEERSYKFGDHTYFIWTEASVFDTVSRDIVYWFSRSMDQVSIDKQQELLNTSMDAASRYTNVIMLVGYAALFTLWAELRSSFTPITELSSAFFLATSVALFVGLEVMGMLVRSSRLQEIAKALNDPENYERRLAEYRSRTADLAKRLVPGQKLATWIAIGCAVAALLILMSAILHGAVMRFCSVIG